MAIVRLSIEVLRGTGEDESSEEPTASAVGDLAELQCQVNQIPGMTLYPHDDSGQPVAPWGTPMRPDTFNLDFDTEFGDETDVDGQALDMVRDYLLGNRQPSLPGEDAEVEPEAETEGGEG